MIGKADKGNGLLEYCVTSNGLVLYDSDSILIDLKSPSGRNIICLSCIDRS